MLRRNWLLLATLPLGFWGCRDRHHGHAERPPQASAPQVRAAALVGESFVVDPNGSTDPSVKQVRVAIRTEALDKEFLLQGALISQVPVPEFSGLKSRVVAFKRRDNKLYLMEATQGHTINLDFPQNLVLAEMPILETTADAIYFDFNQGMSELFLAGDWYATDASGSDYTPTWSSVKLNNNYLEEATFAGNTLVLRQVAQIVMSKDEEREQRPVEIKYYLGPYKPAEGFRPTDSPNFDVMGFFAVYPQHKLGAMDGFVYATKHDHRQKIRYALSANTPVAYRQAIRDGVLYWNKAFGREVLEVVDADERAVAPDFNHNMIQWVDFDDAGYAYADAQMDPRTGQIMHAQIFMTSAFAFSGKERTRKLLRRLQDESAQPARSMPRQFGLRGFESRHLCVLNYDRELLMALTKLLDADKVDDDAILRVSQDYVREVVAHEIGHTLGLRHNFAGTLAANFAQTSKKAIFDAYLKDDQVDFELETSSSVMAYQRFEESTLTGHRLRKPMEALSYDRIAIAALYDRKTFDPAEVPAFCTDTHVGKYMDCDRFTSGASPFEYARWYDKMSWDNVPYQVFEKYIATKSKGKDIRTGAPDPTQFGKELMEGRARVLRALSPDVQVLQVRRTLAPITPLNQGSIQDSEGEHLRAELQRMGGLLSFFTLPKAQDVDALFQKFVSLLDDPRNRSGEAAGHTYTLSEDDIALMRQDAAQFFRVLPRMMALIELKLLLKVEDINEDLKDEAAELMQQKALGAVVPSNLEIPYQLQCPDGKVISLTLPRFGMPFKARMDAAQLLRPREDLLTWGLQERYILASHLEHIFNKAMAPLGITIDDIKTVETLPKEIMEWVLENREVYKILTANEE